ncbi:MAG: winged helix-turn-helix domain-containing protein, partial [Phycisphaerae bacterium]
MSTQQSQVPPTLRGFEAGRGVFEHLRAEIESGRLRTGDRIASLRNLARDYAISIDACRLAISRLEKMQLVRTRRGSGIYVSEQVSSPSWIRQRMAAILMDVGTHVFGVICEELNHLLQNDQLVPITFSHRADSDAGWRQSMIERIDSWHARPPQAVVLGWNGEFEIQARLEKLRQATGCPIIATEEINTTAYPWYLVQANRQMMAQIGATYFLARGHRRIGYVTHSRRLTPEQPANYRKRTTAHTEMIVSLGHVLRQAGLRDAMTVHYNADPHGEKPALGMLWPTTVLN